MTTNNLRKNELMKKVDVVFKKKGLIAIKKLPLKCCSYLVYFFGNLSYNLKIYFYF